jgi:hypothetical protein
MRTTYVRVLKPRSIFLRPTKLLENSEKESKFCIEGIKKLITTNWFLCKKSVVFRRSKRAFVSGKIWYIVRIEFELEKMYIIILKHTLCCHRFVIQTKVTWKLIEIEKVFFKLNCLRNVNKNDNVQHVHVKVSKIPCFSS